jgi:pSer/pThr/pTyr-binding forkhead associated (FHA) protein
MPLLHDGAERCTLSPGSYTLGGTASDALHMTRLETCPPVATIVVPPEGPTTIQRITAAVIVRVDRNPIGIAPKELRDGDEIQFGDCRLTFLMDADAAATDEWAVPSHPVAEARSTSTGAGKARIVNDRTGEAIELTNQRIVIGRDDSCDFVVRSMRVSRRHFSVAPVQGGYLLRDESANGTVVNGSRIAGTYLLGHGDVLRLDEEELRFEVEGAESRVTSAAPTALLDLSYVREVAGADVSSDETAAAALEIVRGQYSGASFSIDRAVCSIGRAPKNDVQIRDESVSLNHATLLRKGASWFVVDLRSANGTFVDGSRVAGEREITSGTRIKLGAVELEFRTGDKAEAPREPKAKASWMRRQLEALRRL